MGFAETGFSLKIDLSRGSIDKMATDQGTTASYLGGQGSAAKILWEGVAPEADPCSPDNLLVFSVGLLVGTPVPGANRTSVSSISPQTGRYINAGFGGFWGAELKHAGYDSIVIRGKSPTPVYLWVDNNRVELRDAGHLAGKSALETTSLIQNELGSADIQVAAIGLAGENKVSQATIDHCNCSASQGVGVVMGDKGLKAIAVRGTRDLSLARPAECFQSFLALNREIDENTRCGDVWLRPDDDSWPVTAGEGAVTGYWAREQTNEWTVAVSTEKISYQWENYSQELEEVHETVVDQSGLLRGTGCYSCPKGCHQAVGLPEKRLYFLKNYARLTYAMAAHDDVRLNYDLLAAMQDFGLNEYAMIHVYAFACRLVGAGILTADELPGFPSDPLGRFAYLIEKVARRDGIGDLLAEGMYEAALRIGKGAEAHARIVQGLELLPLPRASASPSHLLMAATGDKVNITQIEGSFPRMSIPQRQERQAFVENWAAAPERFKEWFLAWEPGEQLSPEAAVNVADWNEGMHYLDDALGICPLLSSFRGQYGGQPPYHLHNLPQLIAQAAGIELDAERLWEIAGRIRQLVRGINACRRTGDSDGQQPPCGMPDDQAPGGDLLQAYYRFRGWTADGVPTRESLERLGLHFVSDELVRRGIHGDSCSP